MCLLPSLLWTPVLSCSSCVSCHCGDSLPFLLRILLVREGSSYGRSQARVSSPSLTQKISRQRSAGVVIFRRALSTQKRWGGGVGVLEALESFCFPPTPVSHSIFPYSVPTLRPTFPRASYEPGEALCHDIRS